MNRAGAIFEAKRVESNLLAMTKNRLLQACAMAGVALTLWGCAGSGDTANYEATDLAVVLAGPLFEGPNQGQTQFTFSLAAAIGEAFEPGMKVRDARIQSAEVLPGDSLGFAHVRSFVLSFASDNPDASMVEAGFKNPLPDGVDRVDLDVAPNVELGPHMAAGEVYVVLDADLDEDYWDGDRRFLLNLELNITY